MAEKTVEQRVISIVVVRLGFMEDQVGLESRFIEDLAADSLDQVELVMDFEEEFGIEVPDEDAEKLLTVGDAVKYLKGRIQSIG